MAMVSSRSFQELKSTLVMSTHFSEERNRAKKPSRTGQILFESGDGCDHGTKAGPLSMEFESVSTSQGEVVAKTYREPFPCLLTY